MIRQEHLNSNLESKKLNKILSAKSFNDVNRSAQKFNTPCYLLSLEEQEDIFVKSNQGKKVIKCCSKIIKDNIAKK